MISCLLLAAVSVAGFEFQDAFQYPDGTEGAPAWFADSVAWEVDHGVMNCQGGRQSFAILEHSPHATDLAFEATVRATARVGDEWCVAGVSIRRDNGNFWRMGLVESPVAMGKTRHVELCEMLDAVWLSQSEPATQLKQILAEPRDFTWEYDHPYRLRIVLAPGRIDGFVNEIDGLLRFHVAYALDNRAVTCGQAALSCNAFDVTFDDVSVRVNAPAPAPESIAAAFPSYTLPGHTAIASDVTGFFYPKEIDGRWWLIDPNGMSFFIVGTDHVNYRAHWCQKLGYAPYATIVEAKYGSEEKWGDTELQRLAEWNFNALPAGHSASLRHKRFPHIEFLSFGSSFSDVEDICPKTTWTGFPNVFSPKWPRHCDKLARQACAPIKDDPWLIGYFLDNELEWFGKNYKSWGLFDEAWKKPASHSAKQAWVDFLKEELKDPAAFKELWGLDVPSFDALAQLTAPAPPLNKRAEDIALRWTRRIAEAYFKACADAIRRHDPHHLILGNRFAGDAPDIWDIAGKYCDVVSFNIYPRIDVDEGVPASVRDQIDEWHRKARKPMMVTEWSFPALDTDRPSLHGAGMRVDTQAQRAQCFTHFQTFLFSLPFMVGSDYFMFADEPALGITDTFPEDSNYGLVNEQDEPYPDLTHAAQTLNARVYELHAKGELPPMPHAETLAAWFATLPETQEPIPDGKLSFSTGSMKVEGPYEGHAWRLWCGDTLLGDFYPLLHQEVAQSLWVPSDQAKIIAVRHNEHAAVVDMELSRAEAGAAITRVAEKAVQADAQNDRPRRFRSAWRFWIPIDAGGWLASQCLWVENTDETAWRLADVFQYLMPAIGGAPDGDLPLMKEVPNYYQRGAAWIDPTAGKGVGCWFVDEKMFTCYYWKDPGGGFHADLRQKIDLMLEPGQRHAMESQPVFYFPLEEAAPKGFGTAVEHLKKSILAKQ